MKLRAHHALCVRFFEGKGYSPEFIENLSCVVDTLRAGDPLIELTASEDIICSACPHNIDGVCETHDKVSCYDKAVLQAVRLQPGSTLHWSELSRLVKGEIFADGKMRKICGKCQWYDICGKKKSGH